jgi:p-cumate 2,3-dioxygenase alpha subunit
VSDYINDDRVMPRFQVNRRLMVDPDILCQEREKIFDECWLYLGHETELKKKNDFKTRSVGGRPLIFFRNSKGEIKVWINSCPHRGALLCRQASGNTRFMTCFYHGWTFSNSGEMVSLPDDAGYGPNYERPSLAQPAKVDSFRGFVFVTFNKNSPDLRTFLAGATDYLDLIADQSTVGMEVLEGSHEYSIKANWKLLVENSYDSYHASSAHQRYFEMVIAARGQLKPNTLGRSAVVDLGNGHAVIASLDNEELFGRELNENGKREKEARMATLREIHGDAYVSRMQGTRNLVIFPNLVIIDLVMGVVIRKIDPISSDYMEVTAWELVPPEDGPDLMRQRLDNFLTFWGPGGLASPDDVEALEACQRGFAGVKELPWSDISRGMHKETLASSDELQMRTWWRRWHELVTGEALAPEVHAPHDDRHFAKSLLRAREETTQPS